jgi:ribonuclease T1
VPRSPQRPSSTARLIVIGLGVLLIGALIGWSARGGSSSAVAPSSSARSTSVAVTTSSADSKPSSGCPAITADDTVTIDRLPPEAAETLQAIDAGPPYPFKKDGTVFQNREKVLPKQANGYYHEFTVVTPGSSDRGARRVIAGDCDERWYTDDHYATFQLIVGSP